MVVQGPFLLIFLLTNYIPSDNLSDFRKDSLFFLKCSLFLNFKIIATNYISYSLNTK